MTSRNLALGTLSPRVSKLGHAVNRRLLRVVVSVLQVVGLFPYRWAGPPHRPAFSVALFLWSLFSWMFLTVGVYLKVCFLRLPPPEVEGEDLDAAVSFVRSIAEQIGVYMSSVFLLARTRGLARVLEQVGGLLEAENLSLDFGANYWIFCLGMLMNLVIWAIHYVKTNDIFLTVAHAVTAIHTVFSVLGLLFVFVLFKTLSVTVSGVLVDTVNGLADLHPTEARDIGKSFRLAEKKVRKVGRK